MMDNELYCPMKMTSNPLGRCVCEKEKCAWWMSNENCCAVLNMSKSLDYMGDRLVHYQTETR
nr:MAG TPA: hypothetical protein [Caudoviricetes sp.]